MTRVVIETLARQLEAAYRADPFHALRQNLESVQPDEWSVHPAGWRADVFGQDPVLSICDQVAHVAGAKFMYADRAFGAARLEWGAIEPPARDRESMLAWLDEGHAMFAAGLVALEDDEELAVERPAPWGAPLRREQLIGLVINHDLYHAGEINRQRDMIRGAEGWDRS